jgi:ribokinase
MAKRPKVTVLGSLNMDISVTVPRLPGPGATVVGSAARFSPGGKGANQAVAAARLGADVRMVGCVGDDDFGRQLLAALSAEGIDAGAVRIAAGVPTGLAMIAVDAHGENLITVAPGANHHVGPSDVAVAGAGDRDILVVSAEIPGPAIIQVLAQPGPAILNLAPAPQNAAAFVAAVGPGLDWLVVNESEAAAVLGRPVDGLADAALAAAELVGQGPRHAVVTVGAHGAALASADGPVSPVTIEARRRAGGRRPGPGRHQGRRRRGRCGRHPARRPDGHARARGNPRRHRCDLARCLRPVYTKHRGSGGKILRKESLNL